jgi:hypothetical protein
LLQQAVVPLLSAPARIAATDGYNAFPWDYFKGDLERGWMVVAVLALCWGLARLERGMWVVSGWLALTFAILNIGPGTWLVNNNAWAITLFLPGALAVGWGAEQWLALGDWLRAARFTSLIGERMRQLGAMLIPALLAGLLAYAGWRGLLMQISIPNPTTRLAWAEDVEALQWVSDHTPQDAVFAINGWQWLNTIWAGADGGAWLGPLTGRATTLPPVDYTFQATWAPQVREFNTQLAAITDASSPEMLALLQEQQVTHIYIGAKGGTLKPEMFTASEHYRLLYTNGAAWVFEVIYKP